jgi:hypothetical protein
LSWALYDVGSPLLNRHESGEGDHEKNRRNRACGKLHCTTVVQGADGLISTGRHPSKIFWFGGTAKDLADITRVKIVGNNGEVLIDGELNTTYGGPRETADGVEFSLF